MAVTTTISKPLENGYVQVDAKYKGGYGRYYKVPKNSAKFFAEKFKDHDKKMNLYSNIGFAVAILTGAFGAAYLTRKMQSRLKQFLIETASAVGLATLTSLGINQYAQKEEENILKKYNAKEIFYKA